ncbi:MAG: protein-tyrosine kinase [Phenylobacterium sp.]|jgi:protein-tyrosine kinase
MTFPYLYQEIDRIYAKTIGRGVRTLSVTSSVPEEGTTSVVCALAQRATAVNLKVLIVDLNLHNPFVSGMIDTHNQRALTAKSASAAGQNDDTVINHDDGLSGEHSLIQRDNHQDSAEAQAPAGWNNAIDFQSQAIDIEGGPGINIIPIPSDDNNQVRFREHAMLNQMINYWLEHHDCIIFDTSPLCLVNQKNIPAQHIATCCDAAVLVVKSGKTQTHQLKEAMEILHTVEVNLAGTVMNDLSNPLLGVELIRQCQKLKAKMPRVSQWLVNKIKKRSFLFAEF